MSVSSSPSSTLDSIFADLSTCLERELFYPALLVALTIPEICVTLGFENRQKKVTGAHYSALLDKYTTVDKLGLSGTECYQLRCGVVHRGNPAGHPKFGATHVIFTIPKSKLVIHSSTLEAGNKSATVLDLPSFCEAIKSAVWSWYSDNAHHPFVAENMKNVISYRHFGVFPFFNGVPVVASGP